MWFYYRKMFDGSWTPTKSLDKPRASQADGSKAVITGMVELSGDDDTLSLATLQARYPVPAPVDGGAHEAE